MACNPDVTHDIKDAAIELDFSDIVAMETETRKQRMDDHVTNTTGRSSVVALLQMTFHVIASALSVSALTSEWDDRRPEAIGHVTMVTFLVAGHVIGNAFSLVQIYRHMNFGDRKSAEFLCISLHLLLLAPIWRGVRSVVTKEEKDILELNCIRLIITHLADLPFILIQIYSIVHQSERFFALKAASVLSSFVALYVAIILHNYTFRSTYLKSSPNRTQLAIQCFSQFTLLVSRCLALVLFLLAWRRWLALLLTGHSLLVVIVFYLVNAFSKRMRPLSTGSMASWFVLCLDWLELNAEHVKGHRTAFYIIVVGENLAIGVCFLLLHNVNKTSIIAVAILISCLVIGLLCQLIKAKLSPVTSLNITQSLSTAGSTKTHDETLTFGPVSEISATFTNPAFIWSENIQIGVHQYSNKSCHNDSGFVSKYDDSVEMTALPPRYDVTVLDTSVKDKRRNRTDLHPSLSSTPRKAHARTSDVHQHRCQGDPDVTYDVIYRSVVSANGGLSCPPRPSSRHLSGSSTFPSQRPLPHRSTFLLSTACLSTTSNPSSPHLSDSYLSSSDISSCTETLPQLYSSTYPAELPQIRNGISLNWSTSEKVTKCTRSSLPKDAVSWRDSVITWLDKYTTNNIQ